MKTELELYQSIPDKQGKNVSGLQQVCATEEDQLLKG